MVITLQLTCDCGSIDNSYTLRINNEPMIVMNFMLKSSIISYSKHARWSTTSSISETVEASTW